MFFFGQIKVPSFFSGLYDTCSGFLGNTGINHKFQGSQEGAEPGFLPAIDDISEESFRETYPSASLMSKQDGEVV